MKRTLSFFIATILPILSAHPAAPDPNHYVLPPHSTVFGKEIAEWTVEWWKWAWGQETNENPILDPDGRWAHNGQSGPVFFMPTFIFTPGTPRHFTVPDNKFILLNVWSHDVENIDVHPPWSVAELRDFLNAQFSPEPPLYSTINGVTIPDLHSYREPAPIFSYTFTNANNLRSYGYGHSVTGLVDPILLDGYWRPLPPGNYVFGGHPQWPDVTTTITVVPENEHVAPAHSTVLGKSIADWTVDWWKWVYSQPTNQHPMLDPDGRWAHRAQEGPVFYVAGSYIVRPGETIRRTYRVPHGKHLLFPVNIMEVDNIDVIPPWDLGQMRDFIENAFTPRPTLYFRIDGVAVTNVLEHRELSPGISFVFESPNNLKSLINPTHLEGITGLLDPIAMDGWWMMLKPLPPGTHVIEWGGMVNVPGGASFSRIDTITVGADPNQYVMPSNAVVGGKTIGEWTAEWWKWLWTSSTNRNAFFDTDGRWASVNQPDAPVFFLAGLSTISGTVNRSFAVPEGKCLLFPVINSYCDNVDVGPPPFTVEELRQCALVTINSISELHASIGGVPITNLFGYRQISPVFSFYHYSADNMESWAAGHPVEGLIDPAVADGYWIMLEPLPRGTHVLNFGGTTGQPDHFTIDITDTITVGADPNQNVLPSNAVVGGKTIGEWTAECWKWVWSISTNENPQLDCDGRWANNRQPYSEVFFIAPLNGVTPPPCTRTFTVPENRHLLVPLLALTVDNINNDPPLQPGELRDQLAAAVRDPTELHATIDGVAITNLLAHRATSPAFTFDFGPTCDNSLSFTYQQCITNLLDPIIVDGYWLMLESLPQGEHTIRVGGADRHSIFLPHDLILNVNVVASPTNTLPPPPPMVSTNLLAVDCPSISPANPSSLPREDFWVPDGPVNAIVETNGVLYIGGLFDYVSPGSLTGGAVDQLSGAPVPNLPKVNGAIKVIEPDRAGGWFVGGIFNSVGSHPLRNLAHILADGTVDTTWAPNPDGGVLTMVAAPEKLYVGGTFKIIGGQPRSLVAALEPGTGTVLPFLADAHTTFPKPSVNALLLSDGTLYLAGYFSFINGAEREHLGSVDAETGMVTSWHPNGYAGAQAGSRIDALAILENILFVGGTFTSIGGNQTNGPARNFIAALNVNGPDFGSVLEWDPNADAPVTSLAATCDTLYVGGAFTRIGGQPRNRIAAMDLVTGRATDWNPNANGDVLSLRLAGNTLYAGGKFTEIGGAEREFLAALDIKTGQARLFTPKADFGIAGLAVAGGTVYAGGGVAGGGVLRKNLAAFDVRTGRPLNWAPTATGESVINAFPFRGVYALAAAADTLYLGGPFTQINGQPRNHVAAVAISTGQPTPWQPNVNGIVEALTISGDNVFLGGRFTHVSGLPRQNIAAVDAVSGAISAWNPGANDKVKALLACNNVLFAGGLFTSIAGAPHNRLAALEIDSGLSFNWNPTNNDQVSALSFAEQTIYVGGQFSAVNGEPRNRVAALDLVSGTATCWNPGARMLIGEGERSAAVNAIAHAGDTVFVGGSFNSIDGQPRNNLAALSSRCPAVPAAWNPNADGPVTALAIRGDTLFAAGGFQNLNGQSRPYLAVFPPQGAPRIALQPRSEQVGIGVNVTLGAEATGDGSLAYQWQFNGANIPGATTTMLTIANAQVANSGEYTLIVTNSLGFVSSRPATLTVLDPVTIVVQPRDQKLQPGRTVTLTVAATGSPAPAYQWRRNGVNIPGAIFPTLLITNAQPTDGGSYSVVVANVGGAVSSDTVLVSVKSTSLPFQDSLSERHGAGRGSGPSRSHKGLITGISGVGSGDNERAGREPDEPNHAGKIGGKSVWLRWLAPASGIATFSTRGSSFDTLLAVYTGDDFTDLLVVAADEDRGGFATSETSFNATAGTEYLLAIDGLGGAFGDIVLSWSLDTSTVPFPRITLEPRHQTVTSKAAVVFEVDAVSTTPLRFQWFFGCRLLAGETNRLLFISHVTARTVGGYRCLVMNDSTHVAESLEALLEIGPVVDLVSQDKLDDVIAALSEPPPSFEAGGASAAAFASGSIINVAMGSITPSQLFDNTGSATSANEPNHCAVLGGASKWFAVHPLENATLVVDTIGSSIDTVLAVYTGPNALQLSVVACDDNGAPDRIRSLTRFEASNTTNYWVVVDGVQGSVGNIQLNWKLGRGPTIISTPRPATPRLGETFVLEVTSANAIPNPTFQWFHNGIAMVGYTNSTLTIENVQTSDAGTYNVVIENYAGSTNHSFGTFDVALPITVIPAIISNNGTNYLRLTGAPAKKYMIEACTELLQPWTSLYTNTADTTVPINFLHPQTNAWRYYRVVPWP